MMNLFTLRLWAKSAPHHFLWRHILDTAALCRALQPRFWPDASIPTNWLCFLVAVHDIGKADALFQQKDRECCVGFEEMLDRVDIEHVRGFRHEARSAEWLETKLNEMGWGKQAIEPIVYAIRGHHGNFASECICDEDEMRWEPVRNELALLVENVVGPLEEYAPANFDTENASVVGLMLSGLIVLCDWIASNDRQFYGVLAQYNEIDPIRYFASACERAREVVGQLELERDRIPESGNEPLTFSEVWENIATLRPSQKALSLAVRIGVTPGLAILEAPMGEGKTEGAVFLAEEWNRQRGTSGAYIALPTQATSNQMYGRYRQYLRRRSPDQGAPRLVHGMAWLRDDKTPESMPETDSDDPEEPNRALEWFSSAKRALLAPEGVGTVDQALMAALNVKHGFLRLFGLGQKVLIVDEVHAYDAFMTTILCRLLEWCRALEIPVILLSATLSQNQKAQLVGAWTRQPLPESRDYPLLTFVGSDSNISLTPVERDDTQRKTIWIQRHDGLLGDAEKIAALAKRLTEAGGCLCVLVNSVRMAQETFLALEKLGFAPEERFLFHARFPADRRDEIEKEIVGMFGPHPDDKSLPNPGRPKKAILVATQVVEQSLDVCFDSFITEISPIDLILQRCGRLYRHTVNPRPNPAHQKPILHILMPRENDFHFGVTGKIYYEELLLRTLSLLKTLPQHHEDKACTSDAFELPGDFRPLIEGCYGGLPLPEGLIPEAQLEEARKKRAEKTDDNRQQGKTHLIPPPNPRVFQYGQPSRAVAEPEEGEKASYLRAQTRLGDDTRAVLVLSDKKLISDYRKALSQTEERRAAAPRWTPPRSLLQRLFHRKVNLASWWFFDDPIEGYEPLEQKDAPRWLRGHSVLIAPNGIWKGMSAATKNHPPRPVEIQDDSLLGIRRLVEARDEAKREADSDV